MEAFQQFAAVAAVLGLLLAALWLLRSKSRLHLRRFQRRRTAVLESLDQLTLTAQHSLHLVRIGKQVVVLGICPAAIPLIREVDSEAQMAREIGQ